MADKKRGDEDQVPMKDWSFRDWALFIICMAILCVVMYFIMQLIESTNAYKILEWLFSSS